MQSGRIFYERLWLKKGSSANDDDDDDDVVTLTLYILSRLAQQ
jgi:hypothetical protein